MSRASSPENDFVDVESTDRPQSAASGNSQRPSTSSGLPVTPETKRNRGRPRKFKENSEEGLWRRQCYTYFTSSLLNYVNFLFTIINLAKSWKIKRGRGRPRKNSMTSDLSNTQNSYLEEGKLLIIQVDVVCIE